MANCKAEISHQWAFACLAIYNISVALARTTLASDMLSNHTHVYRVCSILSAMATEQLSTAQHTDCSGDYFDNKGLL